MDFFVFFSAFSPHTHDPFQFGCQMSDDSQMSVSFLSFGRASVSFGRLPSTYGQDFPLQCCVVELGGLSGRQDLHQMQSRFVPNAVKICTKCNQDLCILKWNILKYFIWDWLSTYLKDISGIEEEESREYRKVGFVDFQLSSQIVSSANTNRFSNQDMSMYHIYFV